MPENIYSVSGYLTVNAANAAAAQTAAQTAITAINGGLATLANGTEFSVVEDESHNVEFDIPDGEQGAFNAEAQLIVPADTQGDAQELAEAALAAINTAIAAQAGTSVSLQEETEGAEGGFVFNLLQ